MASVTKNPMILQSALYVYNWFMSLPEEQKKFLVNNEMLNHLISDEKTLYNIENILDVEKHQENVEERLENTINELLRSK